jgi:hypothetical protein
VLGFTFNLMHMIALFLAPLAAAAARVPYEHYILAPASRDLIPASVYQVEGSVTNANALTQPSGGNVILNGVSSVTYDFGKNVEGLVSLEVGSASSSSAFLGVTFTESSLYVSSEACDATADAGLDAPLWFPVGQGAGKYTPEEKHLRGAFRYLTVVSNTSATVPLHSLHVNFTAAPMQSLRDYSGWFHSDDELINRIWYAGAYTNQLCTIKPARGNALVHLGSISSTDNISLPQTDGWWNNYTITNGSSTITDGAKRDRLVWPGDMSIALESIAVSTGDLYSIRMGLESLLALQQPNGRLPYAGRPFFDTMSYTYHLHSLIGISYLYRFSGDQRWLSNHWSQYVRGVQWALSSVDSTGLANITASADWLRFGMGGHVSFSSWLPSHMADLLTRSRTSKPTQFSISFSRRLNNWPEHSTRPRSWRSGVAPQRASSLPPTSCCGMMKPGCIVTIKQPRCILRMEIRGPSRPT